MPIVKKHISGRPRPIQHTQETIVERRAIQARRAIQRGEENFLRIKKHARTRTAALAFLNEIDLKPIQHLFDTFWPAPVKTTDNKER